MIYVYKRRKKNYEQDVRLYYSNICVRIGQR